jgi:hypothetical protein
VVDHRKFVLPLLRGPLLCGHLIVETKLDLGDRSERFMVERDSALCDLLNGDVGHLCGKLNLGNKSCVTCACLLRFIYCSCIEFDLTQGVIPSD